MTDREKWQRAYDAAKERGDTRGMHAAGERLKEATHAQLDKEIWDDEMNDMQSLYDGATIKTLPFFPQRPCAPTNNETAPPEMTDAARLARYQMALEVIAHISDCHKSLYIADMALGEFAADEAEMKSWRSDNA